MLIPQGINTTEKMTFTGTESIQSLELQGTLTCNESLYLRLASEPPRRKPYNASIGAVTCPLDRKITIATNSAMTNMYIQWWIWRQTLFPSYNMIEKPTIGFSPVRLAPRSRNSRKLITTATGNTIRFFILYIYVTLYSSGLTTVPVPFLTNG